MPSLASRAFAALLYLCLALPIACLTPLDDTDLGRIPSPGQELDAKGSKLLTPLLIPRVPGTQGSLDAQRHLVDFFTSTLPKWQLQWQNSTSKTPATGDRDVPFANLIFRRDPPGVPVGDVSRLTLVAHYDSKLTPEGFIGATDSAAPCAMMMFAARSLDEWLTQKWETLEADTVRHKAHSGVQIVFLDGEEAFVRWTDEDSLYGARSLAAEWDSQHNLPGSAIYYNQRDSVSLFVLLDLLGSAGPNIPSYFLTTHWAYRNMATIEERMRKLGLLQSNSSAFLPEMDKKTEQFSSFPSISDDHVPFMKRGTNILHIIPSPFPTVWHKMTDNGDNLDDATVRDWAKIVTAFVAEWMDLSGFMAANGTTT
ncbi:hypothetical protein CDD82_5696 [Ophiocordyceps australis]|uniref:Peptide hydrolase n=1 Tax=Ophiocordyceps australis TaxID=1399860 RepID=A0A2C5YZR3_9HYPO|nr:hypothetical protein CDD82_5696 [Ophiocordyceps australis]